MRTVIVRVALRSTGRLICGGCRPALRASIEYSAPPGTERSAPPSPVVISTAVGGAAKAARTVPCPVVIRTPDERLPVTVTLPESLRSASGPAEPTTLIAPLRLVRSSAPPRPLAAISPAEDSTEAASPAGTVTRSCKEQTVPHSARTITSPPTVVTVTPGAVPR